MLHRPRLSPSLVVTGAIACAIAFGPASGARVGAQAQGPPPPPAPNATQRLPNAAPTVVPAASPSASAVPSESSPAPRGRKGRSKSSPDASPAPEPSATPTSPAFATLDGSWEFQLQYIDRTEYSYLTIVQGASGALTGSWRVDNKTYPLEGTYDGRVIKMTVKESDRTVAMSGYVEGASDMVGTVDLTSGKGDPTAFTAEHRPSSKGSIFKKGL
ncbi:MAG: hypothetical protein NVS4B5_13580 [Vulcanimicrobiaceae bacterium]